MDQELLNLQQQGLREAIQTMGRDVAIEVLAGTVEVFAGVRSEAMIDPGAAQQGGFRFKRAFSMRFNSVLVDGTPIVDVIKPGQAGLDDLGIPCRVLRYDQGHTSVRFFFGSVHS